jgi:ABC-type microcin C transport system duplicated ATPase subunit YejF
MRIIIAALCLLAVSTVSVLAGDRQPQPLAAKGQDYFVYRHEGRLFVIGSESMRDKFVASGHLPYTRTLLGAGPMGETVVFEVDKKNPAYAERLQNTYAATPVLIVHGNDDFFVWKHHGRLYVLGSLESNQSFMAHQHLPYTRTLLGAGPQGETVVFEVDKKNPEHVARLQERFVHTAFLIDSNGEDFFVYKLAERYYVIGQEKTSEQFRAHQHLPYTRTLLGAGPQGETVVFEVDKKNPALAERLVSSYL